MSFDQMKKMEGNFLVRVGGEWIQTHWTNGGNSLSLPTSIHPDDPIDAYAYLPETIYTIETQFVKKDSQS